jgi:hypothetical protein
VKIGKKKLLEGKRWTGQGKRAEKKEERNKGKVREGKERSDGEGRKQQKRE